MIKRLAILTYCDAPTLLDADKPLIPALKNLNINAVPLVWNLDHHDWKNFDALLFRSTWDYYHYSDHFRDTVKYFKESGIKTLNEPDLIHWNMHKFYLKELSDRGIRIIPTYFCTADTIPDLPENWQKIVIKPAISAGSHLTHICDRYDVSGIIHFAKSIKGDILIQEYFPEISEDGEYSFIYFDKIFSHAVRKIPKEGDFRVQTQFGGRYEKFSPTLHILKETEKILHQFESPCCYARVDGVFRDGVFYLMELELIEPDLYLQYAPGALARFVQSINNHILK